MHFGDPGVAQGGFYFLSWVHGENCLEWLGPTSALRCWLSPPALILSPALRPRYVGLHAVVTAGGRFTAAHFDVLPPIGTVPYLGFFRALRGSDRLITWTPFNILPFITYRHSKYSNIRNICKIFDLAGRCPLHLFQFRSF